MYSLSLYQYILIALSPDGMSNGDSIPLLGTEMLEVTEIQKMP